MQSLNYKEAADFLKVTEGTLRNWVSKGRIKPHKIGKHVLFFREELEKWVLNPDSLDAAPQAAPVKPAEKPAPKVIPEPPKQAEPAPADKWDGKFLISISNKSPKGPTVTLDNLPGKNVPVTSKELRILARDLLHAARDSENPAYAGEKNHRIFAESSFSHAAAVTIPSDLFHDLKILAQAAARTHDPQAATPEKYICNFIREGLAIQLPIMNRRLKERGSRAITFLCVR